MNNRELFKKIYIEISNVCNLNCPFCLNSKRDKKSLTIEEFKTILDKIKPYTKYLYFHVLGEPLLHKDI
nr:radical SAM protein [Bacilli bacterium]